MDVKLLEYLLTIQEEGSISAAAEKIHISQSALSQNLARIEQDLCTPLFARSGKRLVPTRAGALYLDGARQMIQIKEDTYERLQTLTWLQKHSIRIAICSQVYETSSSRILSAMRTAFEPLHLEFLPTDSSVIPQYLLNQTADAAVYCTETSGSRLMPTLPLFQECLQFAVPRNMDWPGSEISPDLLRSCSFIYPASGTFLHQLVHRTLREQRIIFSDIYRAGNISEIRMLAEHGYGAALLPQRIASALSDCQIYPWTPTITFDVVFSTAPQNRDNPLYQKIYETLLHCLSGE